MTEEAKRISKPALTGFLLALLPGLMLVADILWDVTSKMPANHALAAGLGYSLLALTLAGGAASIWGLIQIRRNQPQFTGLHLARIGMVLTLLNIWFVPHVATVVIRDPPDHSRHNCIYNMRQIDSAKEQWAVENNKAEGTPVQTEDIVRYLRDGQMPRCDKGGTYEIGVVEASPKCSVHGAMERTPPAPQSP